ncbi:MAG: ABC transporter substrate-binding protein, partial [Synechococcales cyanobacterium]
QEKGLFAKHGLDEVHLVRESNWRGIVDGINGGYLDAAQMPSGMPMWLSLGGNKSQPLPIVTSLTMTRNGNAITLAKRFYEQGIYTLSDFKSYLLQTRDQMHRMGVVHPAS